MESDPAPRRSRKRHRCLSRTRRAYVEAVLADTKVHTLTEAGPYQRLKHGIPVVRSEKWSPGTSAAVTICGRRALREAFSDAIRSTMPALKDFDLRANGLVLAGASVTNILRQMVDGITHRVDTAILCHRDGKKRPSRAAALGALRRHLRKRYPTRVVATDHRAHADQVRVDGVCRVLVPTESFASLAGIVGEFDISCLAVAWTGKRLVASAAGMIAMTHGAIILDARSDEAGYYTRLFDFGLVGFDIVLPALDLRRADGKLVELPFMQLTAVRCSCWLGMGCLHKSELKNAYRRAGSGPGPAEWYGEYYRP
jgi:hypothetical protein